MNTDEAYRLFLKLGYDARKLDQDALASARKTLLLKHHPDRPGGSSKAAAWINDAYDVLRDASLDLAPAADPWVEPQPQQSHANAEPQRAYTEQQALRRMEERDARIRRRQIAIICVPLLLIINGYAAYLIAYGFRAFVFAVIMSLPVWGVIAFYNRYIRIALNMIELEEYKPKY